MDPNLLRDTILQTIEASLEAQLRSIRRLRSENPTSPTSRKRGAPPQEGMSQLDMAFAILKESPDPLHISEIIQRIHITFAVLVDRESLVSALSKRVARSDRFARVAKNTFTLLPSASK